MEITLESINKLLRKFGLVLVLIIDDVGEKPTTFRLERYSNFLKRVVPTENT